MKLDENQQKAVKHFRGPALVVAGPGSGKTTVIKERILNLIRNHNIDPKHILAIAFTNAAAAEMNERLSKEPALKDSRPKICTLHVFGKDLIKAHYKQAGFAHKPNNIWDDEKIGEIINREKSRLKGKNEERPVAIYKIEDKTTHQCYIGQTINPDRRKKEHFDHSSNRRLREAIQRKGENAFDFTYEWVPGGEADREETYRINSYRRRAAVNLNKGYERIAQENPNIPIITYKIEDPTTVTCYFGQTTDLESIDKPEGFEIIGEEETWDQASRRIEIEIEKHKNWAVFNEEDPLYAQDSTRRRIEVFCEYFNVSYDEVLEHTQKFEHEMRKFDGMNDDIVKEKSKVYTGQFKPEEISDPVLRTFAKRYEDYKTKAKAIDFLDMLIRSANMLETHPNLHQYYRDKHRYVFVDEFQDISLLDFRLIDLFSENLFAVGDDDQAIYGFRGGDSEIMNKKFGNRGNVARYEITRNYRSTSGIVKYAKTLIEHNSDRRPKNLHADNSVHGRVQVVPASRETVEQTLSKELSDLLTTDFKEVGILARNWRGEINEIQRIFKSSDLDTQGFKIDWEELDDPLKYSDEPPGKHRRKMFLRRDEMEIEVINIHTAKGREWDKVILFVNMMYDSFPDDRNDVIDERKLFYVAMTRAKQELTIFYGGRCQFIPELIVRPTEIVKSEQKLVTSDPPEQIDASTKPPYKQHKRELPSLRKDTSEGKNTKTLSQTAPPKQLINTQLTSTKQENSLLPDQINEAVSIYLDRIIFRDGHRLNLTNNIDKPFIIGNMIEYLLNLDDASVKEIVSFSTKGIESIDMNRFADYCIGPEKTHFCTGIFRNFWNRMWEVVEQSRKIPKHQIKSSNVQ